MAKLTALQRRFIDEYFICGLNGTNAIIRAGYKITDVDSKKGRETAASMASENLRKPHIKAEIEKRLDDHAMSANEVIFKLSEHARGDLDDVLDKFGRPDVKRIRERGKMHLIKKFDYERVEMTDKHGNDQTVIRYRVELHDAQSALVQLGRYHKLFTDKVEIVTWETDAVLGIRSGEIDFNSLAEELGSSLAEELFKQAGVPVMVDESQDSEG